MQSEHPHTSVKLCSRWRRITAFYRDRRQQSGRRPECVTCNRTSTPSREILDAELTSAAWAQVRASVLEAMSRFDSDSGYRQQVYGKKLT